MWPSAPCRTVLATGGTFQPILILLAPEECHTLGCCLRVLQHISVLPEQATLNKTSSPGSCARVLFSNNVATSYEPRQCLRMNWLAREREGPARG